ncbi:fatty acid desaturase-domain-containing protein [Panaeolus papilionaceus]|nr:fatty acid desaturase-domain-containing protein [Panaeolus papilionaceus]
MFFRNGPEYEARFVPPFLDLHDAVPKELLQKNQLKAAYYVARDVALAALLYRFASSITPWASTDFGGFVPSPLKKILVKSSMWLLYWWFQGLESSTWMLTRSCTGHDAGHTSLFNSNIINDTIGFILHSYLLIPYFAWKFSHNTHHKTTGSMERDENYVPYTRSRVGLPDEKAATTRDYSEMFEETPLFTLFRMLVMQGFGWWLYLSQNTMGSPQHAKGTSHFKPSSSLYKDNQRKYIVLSNMGVAAMVGILYYLGLEFFLWYYVVPYLLVNHWWVSSESTYRVILNSCQTVMFTFLHHSDPTIPHYRKGKWTFLRGAAATIDRPLLGYFGRFFFHNISHDHVAHHFFLRAPFYNGPKITEALKKALGEDYNYDSTNTFYALYRSFTQCLFVEDEGDIVFYKNKKGVAARIVAESEGYKETRSFEVQEINEQATF